MAAQITALEYRRRVSLAMNFISDNLSRELTLEEVAGAASFSMFHFHRIFKAVAGETVAGFTWRLRLETAANRLRSTRESVTRIAADCGFSSPQNLARAFQRQFGCSPSAYRRRGAGSNYRKQGNAQTLQKTYDVDIESVPARGWKTGMTVEVRTLAETEVAFVRRLGPYHAQTMPAFQELMQWAGPRGLLTPDSLMAIIYWDNPDVTDPDRCRVDACLSLPPRTLPEGPVGRQTIAGGTYAVCHFALKIGEFHQAWEDAFRWLVGSGYESADRPCFERYYNDGSTHPDGMWTIDICIPLK